MLRLLTVTIIRLLTETRKGNIRAAVAVTDAAGTGLIRDIKSCADCSIFFLNLVYFTDNRYKVYKEKV